MSIKPVRVHSASRPYPKLRWAAGAGAVRIWVWAAGTALLPPTVVLAAPYPIRDPGRLLADRGGRHDDDHREKHDDDRRERHDDDHRERHDDDRREKHNDDRGDRRNDNHEGRFDGRHDDGREHDRDHGRDYRANDRSGALIPAPQPPAPQFRGGPQTGAPIMRGNASGAPIMRGAPPTAPRAVYPRFAPPPAPVERPQMRPGYVWAPGYYDWADDGYVWVAGHYEPDRTDAYWNPPRWELRGGVFAWLPGGWISVQSEPVVAPPPPRPEPVQVRAGFVWVPGYYEWRGADYAWVDGHWEQERPSELWEQGRWERHGKHWRWHHGGWRRRR